MKAADKLRNSLANSGLFDKQKLLDTVANGIRNNGGHCEIIVPYNAPSHVVYCGCHIECDYSHLAAIKEFLQQEGFSFRSARHPISGRPYGYEVTL